MAAIDIDRSQTRRIQRGMTNTKVQRSKPILEVSALKIYRGKTVILDNVNWRVERGQHWIILGANGSGKTSLLSALTGYFTPSGGLMSVLGQQFGRSVWHELRKQIGIAGSAVRQLLPDAEPALITVISGKYAMIDYWGKISRDDRRRASRILQDIECAALANREWGVLSQGERQRVLIGRALMGRPKILILDEPCAGLDPAAREQFLHFLERFGRRKNAPTLILVTHHVEEIMPVFTHVPALRDGRVLATGAKTDVLNPGIWKKTYGARMV